MKKNSKYSLVNQMLTYHFPGTLGLTNVIRRHETANKYVLEKIGCGSLTKFIGKTVDKYTYLFPAGNDKEQTIKYLQYAIKALNNVFPSAISIIDLKEKNPTFININPKSTITSSVYNMKVSYLMMQELCTPVLYKETPIYLHNRYFNGFVPDKMIPTITFTQYISFIAQQILTDLHSGHVFYHEKMPVSLFFSDEQQLLNIRLTEKSEIVKEKIVAFLKTNYIEVIKHIYNFIKQSYAQKEQIENHIAVQVDWTKIPLNGAASYFVHVLLRPFNGAVGINLWKMLYQLHNKFPSLSFPQVLFLYHNLAYSAQSLNIDNWLFPAGLLHIEYADEWFKMIIDEKQNLNGTGSTAALYIIHENVIKGKVPFHLTKQNIEKYLKWDSHLDPQTTRKYTIKYLEMVKSQVRVPKSVLSAAGIFGDGTWIYNGISPYQEKPVYVNILRVADQTTYSGNNYLTSIRPERAKFVLNNIPNEK